MHVVATAGHVDHGKSTLVRALTGMEPDRYAEEQRRGLTIDLGYAWTRLGVGGQDADVAFVDVPGHERFVPTMLAGVGPVPAVLLVVAADGGWMPQSAEHADALAALGVGAGLLVVTRSDLADPAPAAAAARAALAGTSLAGIGEVAVSARTGQGLDDLRSALGAVLAGLAVPAADAPVRLWVDRCFTVRGAGTVVTGTLPAGTVAVGDELALPGGRRAVVRGLQQLGQPVTGARGVARVAVNLRGLGAGAVRRGQALTTPGTSLETTTLDVRVRPVPGRAGPATALELPAQLVLHVGSAAVAAHVRPLGSAVARLVLRTALPLRIGDVALLRDPGAHRVLAGASVLDPAPPPLARRGAARARAEVLADLDGSPDAAGELARRTTARRSDLVAMGVPARDVAALAASPGVLDDGEHLLDAGAAEGLRRRLAAEVAAAARERPLEPGLPLEAARRRLGLPSTDLVAALAARPARGAEPAGAGGSTGTAGTAGSTSEALVLRAGRVLSAAAGGVGGPALPPAVQTAVEAVLADLTVSPFAAPEADRLRELGLGPRELAAAVRAGALARVADGVYLAPAALDDAVGALGGLPDPFTLSQARQAWGTSRRVAVPLLELLDRRAATRRLPDARRTLVRR